MTAVALCLADLDSDQGALLMACERADQHAFVHSAGDLSGSASATTSTSPAISRDGHCPLPRIKPADRVVERLLGKAFYVRGCRIREREILAVEVWKRAGCAVAAVTLRAE